MSLISLLLPLVFLSGIAVFIVALSSRRKSSKPENFTRKVRLSYLYTVIIVSLFLSIGAAIFAWNSAINLALPETTHACELSLQNQRNRALQTLITAFAAIAIGVTSFVYHGSKAKKGSLN